MSIKQSYIFAIAGAAIGLCAVLIFNNFHSDDISGQQYQRDFNQMTSKLNSLTESMNSLTKLTLELDKSFKRSKAEADSELANVNKTPSTQDTAAATVNYVTDHQPDDSAVNGKVVEENSFSPLFQDTENDGAVMLDEWQMKQQESQLISSFDNHFSNESTDAAWANRTEQALARALDDEIFSNSRLGGISCRATLCKIDSQHTDIDSELVFLEQINSRAGFSNTESFYTRDEQADGKIVMTLYISRDGHRLPRFSTTGEIMPG